MPQLGNGANFLGGQTFALFVIHQVHVFIARGGFGVLDQIDGVLDGRIGTRYDAVLAPDHHAMPPQRAHRRGQRASRKDNSQITVLDGFCVRGRAILRPLTIAVKLR